MALQPGKDIPDGTTVNGVEAETLGDVVRVFNDPTSGRPAWAFVALGHTHGQIRAVPLADATRTTSGHLAVPFTKARVVGAPDVEMASLHGEPPHSIDEADERRLTRYYARRDEGGTRAPVTGRIRPAGSGLGRRATHQPLSEQSRSGGQSRTDDGDRERDRLAQRLLTVLIGVAAVIGVVKGAISATRR